MTFPTFALGTAHPARSRRRARGLRRRDGRRTATATRQATLLLDFTPNAVHAGIYLATARGYDARRGRAARRPRAGGVDRRAQAAARRAGRHGRPRHPRPRARRAKAAGDLVGVMALVQRPLAAVLAQPGIARAARSRGPARRRHRAAVRRRRAALGRRGRRRRPGQGAHGHDRLRGGHGAARRPGRRRDRRSGTSRAWRCSAERPGTREFRVDDYGAPPYPELVLCDDARDAASDQPEIVARRRSARCGAATRRRSTDPEAAIDAR